MVAAVGVRRPFEILVSDDDSSCRESVGEALERKGYHTHLTSCGQEAIEVARRTFVHVIIADMNMPGMSGVETVTIIRRETAQPVPGILMSADSSRELKLQALSAQIDSFLEKPLDLRAMRDIVKAILLAHYEADI